MLPTTLAFFIASQLNWQNPTVSSCKLGQSWNSQQKICELLAKDCGSKARWDRPSQSCRIQPPTLQQCWDDGQDLDLNSQECKPLHFSAFCREHNWDYGQEQTVSRILNALNAHDCEEAEGILQKTRRLSLKSSGYLKIEDLRPLRGMPFIEELNLDGQRISDLGPLSKLKKLRKLSLRNNVVFDLSPLLELNRLEFLDLTGNPLNPNDPHIRLLQKKTKLIWAEDPRVLSAQDGEGGGFSVESN